VEVDVMRDMDQTPKRLLRAATVLATSAVLVLLIAGASEMGQAVADQGGQAPAVSSQTDQPERTDGYGSMMDLSQADRDGWSWMPNHMDDMAWMPHRTSQWQWMQEHSRMWTWMRGHGNDTSRVSHPATSNGDGTRGGSGSRSNSGGCW
jgi:hypothetical protein